MPFALRLCVLVALCVVGPLRGQAPTSVLVDFGSSSSQAASATRTWNNSHPGNVGTPLALLDVGGASSGVVLSWGQSAVLGSANGSGTQQPQAGSPLAALGYPGDALRDSLYGHLGNPLGQFQLSGLDPTVVYDFTFAASRMGVSDVRTTTYQVQGINSGAATLDVANNDSDAVAVLGIAPAPGGVITVSVSAAPTNSNPSGFYYLGTMEVVESTGSAQILGFTTASLDFSMVEGPGTATGTVGLQTNNGTSPVVALSAVEGGTALPPAWLTFSGSGTVGTPVSFTVDATGLPVGAYGATVTASAPGYLDATVDVNLLIRAPGALNLLFYGNSYTQGNGTVPMLVKRIAEEAGLPSPNVVARLVGGQNLNYHLTNPTQAAAISTALPLGERWDQVIMQGMSLEATTSLAIGNQPAFIANATQIHANVAAHSPGARATLFQTWARRWGAFPYPVPYATPNEMHAEIQTGYHLARASIEASQGLGAARVAPVGDAFANANWAADLYTPDLSHPSAKGTLVASMVIFTTIFDRPVCNIAPAFGAGSPLVSHLAGLGLSALDWDDAALLADQVAYGPLTPYPGSGEDLVLRTGIDGPATACPIKDAIPLAPASIVLDSPLGSYDGSLAFILAHAFTTGAPPGPLLGFPEVHLDPFQVITFFEGPLPSGGVSLSLTVPGALPGLSILIQGVAFTPSGLVPNPIFTVTNAHEIRL